MERENTPPDSGNIVETHNAEQTRRLPEEIIAEILSRLPVKSLLKFRCVSKSWRSLIGSTRFIKTHLQNSSKNKTFAHHMIILNSISPHERLKQCSLRSLLNETFADSFTADDSINIRWQSICLVGCCNGLVCILLERKNFILWNPSTRTSKNLPDIDDEVKHGEMTNYGFGCDASSGDYKVFAVVNEFWAAGGYQAVAKLYSLKSNSWKTTKVGDVSPFNGGGKFAGGKLHWERIFGLDWGIVSFDLKSELYAMVEQPCYAEGVCYLSLGVLGGCLCVLCEYPETRLDVWVMKQYGVKESWDKMATVPHLHDLPSGQFLTPFCIGPNGEILLVYESTFIIYYAKDDGFRYPSMIEFDLLCEADIYIESLVSLAPDGEQERQAPEVVA